jgi:CBS domain-containing protein
MTGVYSKRALQAFIILLLTYGLLVAMLVLLHGFGIVKFATNLESSLIPLVSSLPFVALYLLVLLAATAGYARGQIMSKRLPFNQLLKEELSGSKMESAGIKTKIRSPGGKINAETTLREALAAVVSARLPILAVVNEQSAVTGVITSHDLLQKFQSIANDEQMNSEKLKTLLSEKIAKLDPNPAIAAGVNESLQEVLARMISYQHTKLVVVKDFAKNEYVGTVDVLDLVAEILEKSVEE